MSGRVKERDHFYGRLSKQTKSNDGLPEGGPVGKCYHLGIKSSSGDFCSWHQKKNESEDAFTDNLQILVRKIIAQKPSFRAEANEQLKNQYAHKLEDQYYAAIAHSVLQTSDPLETFTQFQVAWHLPLVATASRGKLALRQQQSRPLPQ